MLQILAASLLASPLRLAIQCFLIFGSSRIFSHILSFRLVALYISLPVGFYVFGLPGALFGIVFAYLSILPMTVIYAIRHELFDWRRELQLLPALLLGLIAAIAFDYAINLVSRSSHSFALFGHVSDLLLWLKDSMHHLQVR
jgi:uncharacterized membrane protein